MDKPTQSRAFFGTMHKGSVKLKSGTHFAGSLSDQQLAAYPEINGVPILLDVDYENNSAVIEGVRYSSLVEAVFHLYGKLKSTQAELEEMKYSHVSETGDR